MQRHKESLEFLESPYRGSKRLLSPILAARRPYLAPSVQAEDLNTKWVSPQFQVDESGISKSLVNKRRRGATKRQKAKQATIPNQTIDNALFPELDFTSSDENATGSQCQSEIIQSKKASLTRSKCINRDTQSGMAKSSSQRRKDKNLFLFSLGSPRSPIVSGEILVPETPVELQIVGSRMKRLRPMEKTNLKQKKLNE